VAAGAERAAPGVGEGVALEAHDAAAASNERLIAAGIQRYERTCSDERKLGFGIRERSHSARAIGGDECHMRRSAELAP